MGSCEGEKERFQNGMILVRKRRRDVGKESDEPVLENSVINHRQEWVEGQIFGSSIQWREGRGVEGGCCVRGRGENERGGERERERQQNQLNRFQFNFHAS